MRSRSLAAIWLALPPVALLTVALVLAFRGGGTTVEQWAPVAVGAAVAAAALAAVGSLPVIPRQAWPALGALGGFFVWCALSLTWSAAPEASLETVARLALLLVVAVAGASFAGRPGAARLLAVALGVAGAVVATAVEVKVLAGATEAFASTRLAWPIDYANGEAALLWLPVPALLAGAAAERMRPLIRALCAALAALALADGLMTLSRGAALALLATLAVCVVLAVDRSRFVLTLTAILVPVAALAPRLTAGQPGDIGSDAVGRGQAAVTAALTAALLVLTVAAFERTWPATFVHGKASLAIALWACILVAGSSVFVVHYGSPTTFASSRWEEFRNLDSARPSDVARFGSASSNRYDYWRVAFRTFERHPLNGIGAGAFGVPWFEHRAITESVTDAHSWQAGALAETGLIGFVLLALALVLPLVRIVKARREVGEFTAVALGGTAAYFVLHASVDWLFLIPAVAVPGFLALGACASGGEAPRVRLAAGRQRAAVAATAVIAALAAVPVYLAATLTVRGENEAARSTSRALNSLSLAASVNPWAVQPVIVRTQVLLQAGRPEAAVAAAHSATARAPQMWITWRALADAERAAGRRAAATRALARARALNPKVT